MGREQTGEETERERVCEMERCSERVAACVVVNLTVGQFLLKLEKG